MRLRNISEKPKTDGTMKIKKIPVDKIDTYTITQ
jgi:hypothetical protein